MCRAKVLSIREPTMTNELRSPTPQATAPDALQQWRLRVLNIILGILMLIPLPLFVVEGLIQFWHGIYLMPTLKLVSYGAVAAFVFNPKLDYQWRVVLLLANSLLVITYMLITYGEISSGRGYLIATVAIAAIMLNRRATLLVWLCGAAALGASAFIFLGRSEAEFAALLLRLQDPVNLLNGAVSTLIMSAIAAFGALSLVQRLSESLRAAEVAQAERDQAYALLEQRVAERTHELEQALAALQTSEAQHKKVAHSLAASEAYLRALRDGLPDLLFVVDAQGVFLDYHAPENTKLWVPPAEFLGRSLDQVLPPELAEMTWITLEKVHGTGRSAQFEFAVELAPHGKAFEEIRIAPISENEFLILVRDITERRVAVHELLRAKEAAEAADRAKSLFLAQMSHEIRTPLTAIIAASNLLDKTPLTPRQMEYVLTMRTSAELLRHIIGNILDFSKIEAGQIDLHEQPFNLHTCLNDAKDLVAHTAQQRAIGLELVLEDDLPQRFLGDGARLRQVLVNLLGNALKFTEQGSVTLYAGGQQRTPETYELLLRVVDTGIGIAAEHLALIFEPFVRAEGGITRRFDGSGLGLTISKELIDLMGGMLTVTSEPHVGSTFTIVLPLTREAGTENGEAEVENREAEAEHRAPVALKAQQELRILLAEDNPVNQTLLRYLFEHLGYQIDLANHGAEAVALVARQTYDLVFMDIQMPFLDGTAATRQIRALEGIAQPYIVALTASALRGDRERYLEAGMDAYLSKPVQLEELQAILARCAERKPSAPPVAVPATSEPPEADLIDWRTLDVLLDTMGPAPAEGAKLVNDLFCGPFASQMAELDAALASDDRVRMRQLAHKLRGASLQLGAKPLAKQWERLELALRREEADLVALVAPARQLYVATMRQLDAHLGPLLRE
ncbi:MAG: response regulator [Candidatus Viridilinea halotolerans]|uniref:Circadian input-output histidine kinase CikA n=1 Tax=Candidatus Viridilinea halotolerans TaxID=2491704 RepID=A0A426U941_9CHLR|nr:MAG: response regulator [Candidatus Viridilinea halotolerans]